MPRSRRLSLCVLFAVVFAACMAATPSSAVQFTLAGSSGSILVDFTSGQLGAMAVDPSGDVHVVRNGAITRVTSAGAVSPWSSTACNDLVFTPAGDGYGVSGGLVHYTSGGTATPIGSQSGSWSYLARLADGSLYVDAGAYAYLGIFRIDPVTGDTTVVVRGGPGPGSTGFFLGLAGGPDGKLYAMGTLDGTLAGCRLFRIDGSTAVPVASPPDGGGRLELGPHGMFLVLTSAPHSLYASGELWLVDPVSGASNQVASNSIYFHENDVSFGGVAYDPASTAVYLGENWRLWKIHLDLTTPATPTTWGAMKAHYR